MTVFRPPHGEDCSICRDEQPSPDRADWIGAALAVVIVFSVLTACWWLGLGR